MSARFEFRTAWGDEGGRPPLHIDVYEVRPEGWERWVGFYRRDSMDKPPLYYGDVFAK